MYASRYEELNKIMSIMDELISIINLIKKQINFKNESKSRFFLLYIEDKINKNIENIKELENPYLLFIIGCGNYGKSTLINALLKEEIVSTNDIPNTWKLDSFIKSKTEKIEIVYNDNTKVTKSLSEGKKLLLEEERNIKNSKIKIARNVADYKSLKKFNIKELKEYKKEQENIHLYKSDILQIKYYLKKGDLLNDFVIVDTPGLNQTLLKNTYKRMKEYYIKADGVIWLIDACNIVSKENNNLIEEINKIDNIHNNKKNIIAVVNKIDVISKENIDNISKVKSRVNEIYRDKFNDIVYISAKEAIAGILNDNEDLIDKSNINNLYKSIEENFKKLCEEKQVSSKYKNLFCMKDSIINKLYNYKRELYKDISTYNEIEFEINEKSKEIYAYVLNHIESIKNKNIYKLEDICILKQDIENLQNQCSLDLKKLYEVLIKKANIGKIKNIKRLNTNVYFTKSKHLIINYYTKDNTYEKNNKITNQLGNILTKLTIKNFKNQYNDEILIKEHIYKKINNLKDEIMSTLEDKINEIKVCIIELKNESFKYKYLDYSNIKKHIKYLNSIEKILNNLR